MKFLQELVRFSRNTDPEDDLPPEDELSDDEYDDSQAEDFGDDLPEEPDDELNTDEFSDELPDDSMEGDDLNLDMDPNQDLEGEMPDEGEPENPDRAGLIRTVNKAHLVYKRTTDDGSFEEMWMYNVTNLRDEMSVRKAILSGTDIAPNQTQSPDGSQSYELWTAGNAELMLIRGLPQ